MKTTIHSKLVQIPLYTHKINSNTNLSSQKKLNLLISLTLPYLSLFTLSLLYPISPPNLFSPHSCPPTLLPSARDFPPPDHYPIPQTLNRFKVRQYNT